jgi:hypothetical protein
MAAHRTFHRVSLDLINTSCARRLHLPGEVANPVSSPRFIEAVLRVIVGARRTIVWYC